MFQNLTDIQVRLLLQKVADKGMISMEALIEEVRDEAPPQEIIVAAEVLHSLTCKDTHGDGEEGSCAYHQEVMFPDTERLPFHRRWIGYAQSLTRSYGVAPEVLAIIMPRIIRVFRELKEIETVHGKGALELTFDILEERLPPLPPVQPEL
jgi:hypothetical protein